MGPYNSGPCTRYSSSITASAARHTAWHCSPRNRGSRERPPLPTAHRGQPDRPDLPLPGLGRLARAAAPRRLMADAESRLPAAAAVWHPARPTLHLQVAVAVHPVLLA